MAGFSIVTATFEGLDVNELDPQVASVPELKAGDVILQVTDQIGSIASDRYDFKVTTDGELRQRQGDTTGSTFTVTAVRFS